MSPGVLFKNIKSFHVIIIIQELAEEGSRWVGAFFNLSISFEYSVFHYWLAGVNAEKVSQISY